MKSKSRLRFWAKKLLVAFILLLVWNGVLEARMVMISEARLAAARLMEIENDRPDLRLNQDVFLLGQIEPLIYRGQPIAFLVNLKPQGFMILSDITEVSPQVFISFSGEFNILKELPFLNIVMDRLYYDKTHLHYISPNVSLIDDFKTEESPDSIQVVRNELSWFTLLNDSVQTLSLNSDSQPLADVAPMVSSRWNQGVPYWNYTPRVGGQATYTGCSATAMAQIMYYWKYPDWGQGSHSYWWNYQTLSANFNHQYYWDRMLANYSSGYTSEQADAVARLMSDIGIAIDMDYAVDGSGAHTYTNNALVNYFKYSPDLGRINRRNVANWGAWFNIFKQQIDGRLPVILSMYKTDSGHTVAVDGYRTSPSNQIHVNMGWGGAEDNYYSVDNIYEYGDAYWDYALINIHPTQLKLTVQSTAGGTTAPAPGTYYFGYGSLNIVLMTALPDNHFHFLNWSGDASGTQNPIEVNVNIGKTVKANFQRNIYAPLNAAGQKVMNRYLSRAEYINIITFEPNPLSVDIASYKIYLIDSGQRTEVASLDPNTFKFYHRRVGKDKECRYEIVAVNKEPREGNPASLIVK
jgi:hypothetical protein